MKEKKTVFKVFFVWDFEKEEQWLNTMAQSGWVLDRIGFCTYRFVPCAPGEYTVRMEMHQKDENYLRFLEEAQVEYIGRIFQWVYFRRKAQYGSFELFSDLDSKIAHLRRIGRMLSAVGAANLLIGIVNSWNPTHIGWVNLLCATLLMYGLGRIHGKMEALESQRMLME